MKKKIKQNKEKTKVSIDIIKNSYEEMKKTSDEISKLDTDAMDKYNPGLRQKILDLLKDD